MPNLGSVALSRGLARLADDWQACYGHPVLVVETFVDPERFQGSVYRASGWTELGRTRGNGRHARYYYQAHDRPKRLFTRELTKNARRSLQAEHLRPALAPVEAKVPVRSTAKAAELRSHSELFREVPDYRARIGDDPLFALLGLAAFARRLSSHQRAALGVRRNARGEFPAPSQPTFSRMFARVDERQIEAVLLRHQAQVRSAPPPGEVVALVASHRSNVGKSKVTTGPRSRAN